MRLHTTSPPADGPQVFSLLNKGAQTALLNATIVGGAKIAGVWIGISCEP